MKLINRYYKIQNTVQLLFPLKAILICFLKKIEKEKNGGNKDTNARDYSDHDACIKEVVVGISSKM